MMRSALGLVVFASLVAALDFGLAHILWEQEQRAARLAANARSAAQREASEAARAAELRALSERALEREAALRLLAGLAADPAAEADLARRERAALDQRIAALPAWPSEPAVPPARSRPEVLRTPFLFAVVLLAGSLALWALKRARHRRELHQATLIERITAGEDLRIPWDSAEGPVGFAPAFDRMVDAFAAVRRDLERRVDEKTSALAHALEDARALNARLQGVLKELEAAQAELLAKARLAALGEMSNGIAHEFRNILGGIRGCVEDLLLDIQDAPSRETLSIVLRAVDRGRRIVEDLRSFGSGRTGAASEVDVVELCRDLSRLMASEAESRGVRLAIELQEPPFPSWCADRAGVEQVLTNLLLNAFQASPPGATVELLVRPTDSTMHFAVRDRGKGVPEEHWPRLFEPFFTTREREGGSGLGLSVSLGIIEAAGGTLTGQSRDGGGAVFEASWPLRSRSETSAAPISGGPN